MHNKYNVPESSQNHPLSLSMEKLSSSKLISGARTWGTADIGLGLHSSLGVCSIPRYIHTHTQTHTHTHSIYCTVHGRALSLVFPRGTPSLRKSQV